MFSNPLVRIILGVPFAGAIVVALFILMGWLIEPKPIELGESEFRSLSRVTPQEEATEIRRTTRQNVQRIQTADQPPPPPRLSSSRSDVNLPTPQIQGAAPATVEIGNVSGFALDAVACPTVTRSQFVHLFRLTLHGLRNVASKAAVMFGSTWTSAVVRSTSKRLAQITCSSVKLNVRLAELSLRRRSSVDRRFAA